MGLIPQLNTVFGLLPLQGYDVWLHAGTTMIATYFGWRGESAVERPPRAARSPEQAMLVANERRFGHSDRRIPGSEV